jgi:hypothetical protein
MGERIVYSIPGKNSDTEEAILLYLYENPKGQHSTNTLASVLEDHSRTPEEIATDLKRLLSSGVLGTPSDEEIESMAAKRQRDPVDVQTDIESLIVKGLVRGKREGAPGNITHADIQLTVKGDREAIEAKNRDKAIEVVLRSALDDDGELT